MGSLAMLVGGAVLLAAYVAHSRRAAAPIIDLSVFRIPTFTISVIGTSLFRIGVGATPFLLPLLFQLGFGMTPFQSGMITFATAVGALAMKFVAPPILRRFGFRGVLVINAVIASLFTMVPGAFSSTTPIWIMVGLLLFSGFSRSLQFTCVSALAFADVSQQGMSRATTITSVAQQIALSVGISIGAIAVQLTSATSGGVISEASFWPAFVIVGLITLVSALPFVRLARDAGHVMSGHRRYAPDPVTAMRDR